MKPAFARGILPLMASTQLFRPALPSEPDGRGVPGDRRYFILPVGWSATSQFPKSSFTTDVWRCWRRFESPPVIRTRPYSPGLMTESTPVMTTDVRHGVSIPS